MSIISGSYENSIEMTDVTKKYKDFTLDNVSLSLPTGCIMGLVGENGAGKSTIIKLITGAARANSGKISVLGKSTGSFDFDKVKEDIGIVLDVSGFPDAVTPVQIDHIMMGIYKHWNSKEYFSYLERFDLPLKKRFSEFSRGMKMKLSIAAAMSHGAHLLILDEATNGLDPIARDEIVSIFGEFTRNEKNSVLIASHIVSDLEKICDYISFISKGKILLSGEKDALEEKYCIVNCSRDDFARLNKAAVIGVRDERYGVRAMVEREKLSAGFEAEKISIEDIMIYTSRKGVDAE